VYILKKPFYLFLIAATFVLGGCQAAHPVGSKTSHNFPTATAIQANITEQDAASYAVRIAMQSQPEIDASHAAPRVGEIKLTSLQSALQEMHSEPRLDDILSQSVWLVTLDGEWLVGIPGPGVTPTPYRTFYVVLDARGNELRTSVRP
jgi:hypothetical protein